jgi:hypothetical protein
MPVELHTKRSAIDELVMSMEQLRCGTMKHTAIEVPFTVNRLGRNKGKEALVESRGGYYTFGMRNHEECCNLASWFPQS